MRHDRIERGFVNEVRRTKNFLSFWLILDMVLYDDEKEEEENGELYDWDEFNKIVEEEEEKWTRKE